MPTATYVRKPFLDRQAEDYRCLAQIYSDNIIPVKEEIKGLNSSILAEKLSSTPNKMTAFINMLEKVGILYRRLEYPGGGRVAVWSLTAPMADGMKMLKDYQKKEIETVNHPPSSLKQRILRVLEDSDKSFNSPREIAKAISNGTERVSVQRITVALGSLKDEGKITFSRDTSGHHVTTNGKHGANKSVMFDIRLANRYESTVGTALPHMGSGKHPVGVDATDFRNLSAVTEGGPIERILPIVTDKSLAEQYPLIAKMAKRKEFLESAAQLAAEGGEDEIGLTLLNKAQAETSPLNTEILRMWEALNKCEDK